VRLTANQDFAVNGHRPRVEGRHRRHARCWWRRRIPLI
jgi:hypothetical protein